MNMNGEHAEEARLIAGLDTTRADGLHEAERNPGILDYRIPLRTDIRKRFWLSVTLTLLILAVSPGLWGMFGIAGPAAFPGDHYLLFVLSSVVFFYGGWPFLAELIQELKKGKLGITSLVALALSALYVYSSAVNFGMPGMEFYWELAILVDIMLFGQLLGAE